MTDPIMTDKQPTPTEDVAGRLSRVSAAMKTHVLHFALRAVYGRSAPNAAFLADLDEAAQALTALAGRVEEVEREDRSSSRDHAHAVSSALERAAQICEQQAREFLSPKYATDQPLSSFNERFACAECARAIRAAISSAKPAEGESSRDALKSRAEAAESQVQALIAGQREMVGALKDARRELFALCEATDDECLAALRGLMDGDEVRPGKVHEVGFHRGRRNEAKGIARAMSEVFREVFASESALNASAPTEGGLSAESQSQPCGEVASRYAVPEDVRSAAGENQQTPRVLSILQGDVDYLSAALSWYDGGPAAADVRAAWARITGAISAHGAFVGERTAVALAAVARANRAERQTASQELCPKCGGTHPDRHEGACAGPPTPSAPPPHGMQG